MSLRPVHDLTLEEAVQELEALHDQRPPEEEPLALHHWRQDHQARVDELEAWILMRQPKPEPPAAVPTTPTEPPVTSPTLSHDERLSTLLAKLSKATGDATAAPDKMAFERARSQIHQFRFQVKALVERHGLESPALPELPTNPWVVATPPAPKAAKPDTEVPPDELEPQNVSPLSRADLIKSVATVRRAVWLLMADLERTPVLVRKSLVEDLALLDAAAHAAHSLAIGKLETA